MGTGVNITCIRGQLLNSTHPINIEYVYQILYHNFSSLINWIMKHFEEQDLWKYDVFPCSNGDPDIIVSETIRFNELQLLRLWSKGLTIKMFCSNTTSIQMVS